MFDRPPFYGYPDRQDGRQGVSGWTEIQAVADSARRRAGARLLVLAFVASTAVAMVSSTGNRAQSLEPGLVAAYGFDEGAGSTVADASGSGNGGSIGSATWSTAGKYGNALVVQRHDLDRHRSRRPIVAADHRNDARSVGVPHSRHQQVAGCDLQGRRQLLPDRHLRRCRAAPASGGIFTGTRRHAVRAVGAGRQHVVPSGATYDGATMRLFVNGAQVASRAADRNASPHRTRRWRSVATTSTGCTSQDASTKSASTTPPSPPPRSKPT